MHRLRYEPTAQAMPEGDFTSAGTLHFTEQEMLKVTLSRPESLYLRGYIGQRYTADGWEPESRRSLRSPRRASIGCTRRGLCAEPAQRACRLSGL